jgi:hypothetical protein
MIGNRDRSAFSDMLPRDLGARTFWYSTFDSMISASKFILSFVTKVERSEENVGMRGISVVAVENVLSPQQNEIDSSTTKKRQ